MSHVISLSDQTYQLLVLQAQQEKRTPSEIAEEVLARELEPLHPYIETLETPTGRRARIKNTRIEVGLIVGYLEMGETPESLAKEVMPHVSLAAIYDALSYYHDHKAEIDRERAENTVEAGQLQLREKLGEEGYKRLTGEAK